LQNGRESRTARHREFYQKRNVTMKTLEELKELERAVYAAGIDGGITASDAIEDLRTAEAELGLQRGTTCPRWINPSPEDGEAVHRAHARNTPAGRLLLRMGMDYWDTESAARQVAEHAAGEIDELRDAIEAVLNAPGEGHVSMSEPDSFETQCRKASETLDRLSQ